MRVNLLRTFPCSQNPFRLSLHSKHKIYLIFSHTICYLKVATEYGFTGINIQNNKTEPIKQDNRLIQYNWQQKDWRDFSFHKNIIEEQLFLWKEKLGTLKVS